MALQIWTDDEEYVIAENANDAIRLLSGTDYHESDLRAFADDEAFTFQHEEGKPETAETKTAREWCAERGRGYFAATV